jgi:hypothetical protein
VVAVCVSYRSPTDELTEIRDFMRAAALDVNGVPELEALDDAAELRRRGLAHGRTLLVRVAVQSVAKTRFDVVYFRALLRRCVELLSLVPAASAATLALPGLAHDLHDVDQLPGTPISPDVPAIDASPRTPAALAMAMTAMIGGGASSQSDANEAVLGSGAGRARALSSAGGIDDDRNRRESSRMSAASVTRAHAPACVLVAGRVDFTSAVTEAARAAGAGTVAAL